MNVEVSLVRKMTFTDREYQTHRGYYPQADVVVYVTAGSKLVGWAFVGLRLCCLYVKHGYRGLGAKQLLLDKVHKIIHSKTIPDGEEFFL